MTLELQDHLEDHVRAGVIVRVQDDEVAPRALQGRHDAGHALAEPTDVGRDGMVQEDPVFAERYPVPVPHVVHAWERLGEHDVDVGRPDDEDRLPRLPHLQQARSRIVVRHEMQMRQLGDRMPQQLIHRPGDLSTLDVRYERVVQRPDDRAGKRLDPVTVHDDQVLGKLTQEMPESLDRVRQHEIHLSVDRPVLIDEGIDVVEPALVDLGDGRAVAGQHVHPRREDPVLKLLASSDLPNQRLQLAEIRPRAGDEQDAPRSAVGAHARSSSESCASLGMRRAATRPNTSSNAAALIGPVPGRLTHVFSRESASPAAMSRTATTQAYAKSMVACSSGRTDLWPPRAAKMARDPWIKSRNSAGSMEIGTSGPAHDLSDVKCFSITRAPSATAAKHA